MADRSPWDSRSTVHITLSDRLIVAINLIAEARGLSKARAMEEILFRDDTIRAIVDYLDEEGILPNFEDIKAI